MSYKLDATVRTPSVIDSTLRLRLTCNIPSMPQLVPDSKSAPTLGKGTAPNPFTSTSSCNLIGVYTFRSLPTRPHSEMNRSTLHFKEENQLDFNTPSTSPTTHLAMVGRLCVYIQVWSFEPHYNPTRKKGRPHSKPTSILNLTQYQP